MTPPEADRVAPPPRGASGSPPPAEPDRSGIGDPNLGDDDEEYRSLAADVEALFDDGKTYLQAELSYQKTRAAFVADRAKGAFIFGAVAAVFGFLALIGLTVGLIIALTPWLTAWGASAVVVLLLAVAAMLALNAAGTRWSALMRAIDNGGEPRT